MSTQEAVNLEEISLPSPPSKKLHLLVLTSSYAPDRTGMAPLNTEVCEYLASRGHRVTVATLFPHYPEWKVPAKYRRKLWTRETLNGVEVLRGYAYIPPRRTALRRILYDTTIGISTALRALPVEQVDVVLALSPPLQAGLGGWLLARIKRVPLLLEIQDLVPDLAIAVGMLKNSWAIKLARILEKRVYALADRILVISEGFAKNLSNKGVLESKISFLPLWVDTKLIAPKERNGRFRKVHQISETDTVVLYTGNMGAKQQLENVLDAASHFQDQRDVLFLFVGDGSEKQRLQRYAQDKRLANVRFLPLVPPEPKELLPEMLAAADMLVLNQSAQVLDTVIPSKLFTYMAAGRPVVAAVNPSSQAASCVELARSGIAVGSDDPCALADAIRKLKADRGLAQQFGRQGRVFVEAHCDRERILNGYEEILLSLGHAETRQLPLRRASGF